MNLTLWHGRLDPRGGGSDVEGNEVDDWGFDGPVLENVNQLSMTYGTLEVIFETEDDWERAAAKTGWVEGNHDNSLVLPLPEGGVSDCVRIFNKERGRQEFFGDWWCA